VFLLTHTNFEKITVYRFIYFLFFNAQIECIHMNISSEYNFKCNTNNKSIIIVNFKTYKDGEVMKYDRKVFITKSNISVLPTHFL
jgi:hypothetical protein